MNFFPSFINTGECKQDVIEMFQHLRYGIDRCIIISELVWDRKMLWQTEMPIPENMSVNFRGL